jgi:hypothetical protein
LTGEAVTTLDKRKDLLFFIQVVLAVGRKTEKLHFLVCVATVPSRVPWPPRGQCHRSPKCASIRVTRMSFWKKLPKV